MEIKEISIGSIKPNPSNPRTIRDDKFLKLVQSIQEFPEMLKIRPLVVNDDMVVLGGNMRLKACKEAGLKKIPVIKASDLTPEQQKEFIIKDNIGYGDWDWQQIAVDFPEAEEWGLDVPKFEDEDAIIEPSGYDTKNSWFLNIEFEEESKCEEWYNKLIEEGLICKIVQ